MNSDEVIDETFPEMESLQYIDSRGNHDLFRVPSLERLFNCCVIVQFFINIIMSNIVLYIIFINMEEQQNCCKILQW